MTFVDSTRPTAVGPVTQPPGSSGPDPAHDPSLPRHRLSPPPGHGRRCDSGRPAPSRSSSSPMASRRREPCTTDPGLVGPRRLRRGRSDLPAEQRGRRPDDLVNQPADVQRPTSTSPSVRMPVTRSSATDQRCIAIAGHSLGAITDRHGLRLASRRGRRSRFGPAGTHPTTSRPRPRPRCCWSTATLTRRCRSEFSQQAFAQLPGRWFVTMQGAGHVSIFLPSTGRVDQRAAVAYLSSSREVR